MNERQIGEMIFIMIYIQCSLAPMFSIYSGLAKVHAASAKYVIKD